MTSLLPEGRQFVSPERAIKQHEEVFEFLQDPRTVKAMRDALWTKANESLTGNKDLRSTGAHLAALRTLTGERFLKKDEEQVLDDLRLRFHEHIEKGDNLLALSAAADAANISGRNFLSEVNGKKQELLQEELRKLAHTKESLVAARAAADYRALFKAGAMDSREEEVALAQAFDNPIVLAVQRQDLTHAGAYAADRKILTDETESVIK